MTDRTPLDAIHPPSNPDVQSKAAAASMEVPAVAQREAVLALIREHQPVATWRLEELTGGRHQSISARVFELHRAGYIVRVGHNKTPSGRSAHTYAIATGDADATAVPVADPPRDVPCPMPADASDKRGKRCGRVVFLLARTPIDPTFWEASCPVHGKVTVRVA